MSIHVVFEVEALDGRVDELKALLRRHLVDTRARPGCESLTVHQDQDTPTRLVILERWARRADHESYLAWRAGPGAIPDVVALFAARPSIRYFDDVDA